MPANIQQMPATAVYPIALEQVINTRIVQDKFIGWFTVVPIVLVFIGWFLETRQWRYLVALAIGAFGAALLHPITLVQILLLAGGFGLLCLVRDRSWQTFRALTAVGLVLSLLSHFDER